MEHFATAAIILLIVSGVGNLVIWFAWRISAYRKPR
jgi:hypothetical protein